jgi:hypothetical protein
VGVERLVAGVIVIGLLVWGASILATPNDDALAPDPPASSGETDAPDPFAKIAPGDAPPAESTDDGDDDDDHDGEPAVEPVRTEKRKGHRGHD